MFKFIIFLLIKAMTQLLLITNLKVILKISKTLHELKDIYTNEQVTLSRHGIVDGFI